MNELTTNWKIFRIVCIIQMVLVALQWMFSVSGLFYRKQLMYPLAEVIAYGVIFIFVYMGLSLLNDNYPDTPLSDKQRRQFNWLFLVNFLLIAYLFAQLVTEWRIVWPWISIVQISAFQYFTLLFSVLLALLVFLLHLVFLGGMFRLRRVIYENTVTRWYKEFDEEKK